MTTVTLGNGAQIQVSPQCAANGYCPPSGCACEPEAQRECTPEEGARWQRDHGAGYSAGRGDVHWNSVREDLLTDVPAELDGETGAQYAARHLAMAWRIGYTGAVRFEQDRRKTHATHLAVAGAEMTPNPCHRVAAGVKTSADPADVDCRDCQRSDAARPASSSQPAGLDFATMRAEDFDTDVAPSLFDVTDNMGQTPRADRCGTSLMW